MNSEANPPSIPENWTINKEFALKSGESMEVDLEKAGVIEQLRFSANPATSEVLNNLRLHIFLDGDSIASVGAPNGYLFGHGYAGHNKNYKSIGAVTGKRPVGDEVIQTVAQPYNSNYNSMLLGMTNDEVYSMFPMPFSRGAVIKLVNDSKETIEKFVIKADVKEMTSIPDNWGRFNVSLSKSLAATENTPKFGLKVFPVKYFWRKKQRANTLVRCCK